MLFLFLVRQFISFFEKSFSCAHWLSAKIPVVDCCHLNVDKKPALKTLTGINNHQHELVCVPLVHVCSVPPAWNRFPCPPMAARRPACRIVSLHGAAWQREDGSCTAMREGPTAPRVLLLTADPRISHHFVSAYRRFMRAYTHAHTLSHTPLSISRAIRSRAGTMYPRCAAPRSPFAS